MNKKFVIACWSLIEKFPYSTENAKKCFRTAAKISVQYGKKTLHVLSLTFVVFKLFFWLSVKKRPRIELRGKKSALD